MVYGPYISLASFLTFSLLAHSIAARVIPFPFLKYTKQAFTSDNWLIPGLWKLSTANHVPPSIRSVLRCYLLPDFFLFVLFCDFLLNTSPPTDIFHVHYLFTCFLFSLLSSLNPAVLSYFNNSLLPWGLCTWCLLYLKYFFQPLPLYALPAILSS